LSDAALRGVSEGDAGLGLGGLLSNVSKRS